MIKNQIRKSPHLRDTHPPIVSLWAANFDFCFRIIFAQLRAATPETPNAMSREFPTLTAQTNSQAQKTLD
jgi:hypothetical protein